MATRRYGFYSLVVTDKILEQKLNTVDHCLDQVRQALVCNADVSVVHYAWSDIVQGNRPRVDNQHTCLNYTKILEWASSRSIEAKDWHPSRHVVKDENGGFRIERGRNHALGGEGECNAV